MKTDEVDRNKLSPMMAQYMEIKDKYHDTLLFYRLGDFYELFFEDALIASKELELTLTSRASGLDEKVPMCGVPHHAVKSYIEKVVSKGYKVAICEQLEDPRFTKGMVKRGVVDVISKGTIADLELLDKYSDSYIGSVLEFDELYILTLLDISTGKMLSIFINHDINLLINKITHYGVKEVVLENNLNSILIDTLKNFYDIQVDIFDKKDYELEDDIFNNIKDVRVLFGIKHLFSFLKEKELKDLSGINDIEIINEDDYVYMNNHCVSNLELCETIRNKDRQFSLIWLLDKCKTAMGSRKLREWILNPIKDINVLNKRYDMIESLNNEFIMLDELRNNLDEVYDIERLCGKITNGSLNARDLLQLKRSLKPLPKIKEIIDNLKFNYNIETFDKIYELLDKALDENPPISIKEGSMIKKGYNTSLDELRTIRHSGKEFVASFEKTCKEESGIKTLKIGFNKVFGYYIEISKGMVSEVKPEWGWERRQTLANCERYISPALKEKEDMILNAEERIIDLEYELFMDIKNTIKKDIYNLRLLSKKLSEIDVICAFAKDTDEYHLIRPALNQNHILEIINGRHPVVEKVSGSKYVENDCVMDDDVNTLLITGPNMSGKSTFMRQVAITIIMAQIGCFVPCKKANLPIIDKIFTRIGASDDLVGGKSTFMVEMMEANDALVNATKDSLVIFDELGRGTATYDGLSLAQSILEYISENVGCKTLFSTHYHEITTLEKKYSSIKNVHVDASLVNGELVFLHKVKKGAIDKSYGINVASLANMPQSVILRAEEILSEYENKKINKETKDIQLTMDFEENKPKIEDFFKDIDPLNTTPIEALNILYNIKKKIEELNKR